MIFSHVLYQLSYLAYPFCAISCARSRAIDRNRSITRRFLRARSLIQARASHGRARRTLSVSATPRPADHQAGPWLGVRCRRPCADPSIHSPAVAAPYERPLDAQPSIRFQPGRILSYSDRMRRAASIFVIVMLAACSRSTAADAKPQTTPAPAAPAGAQATPPPPAAQLQPPAAKPVPAQLPEVVARVNGEAINGVELESAVKGLEGRAGGPVPADQRDRVYRGVLDDMIGYRLLIQESKARKVAVPDADIEAQIAQIRGQFPSQQQFDQALAAQKMTLQDVRDDARNEIGVEKLVEGEVGSKIAVKPEAVSDFYKNNQDKFQQGPRVRASHILIQVPQGADTATKAAAKTKAEGILKDLKAGKDFAVAAKENSQDPGSAVN